MTFLKKEARETPLSENTGPCFLYGREKKKKKEKKKQMTARADALLVCVGRSQSMAVRHIASKVNVSMRAAARTGVAVCDVGACIRTGQLAVTALIRQCCADPDEHACAGLDALCLREAIGSVAVHRIKPSHIHSWDDFARLEHVVTIIVAGSVNDDAWRLATMRANHFAKRRYIYFTIIATADAWAKHVHT